MKWRPQFDEQSCAAWLTKFRDNGILGVSNSTGNLAPPFSILIPDDIREEIRAIHLPNEETGGIMFASLGRIGNDNCLRVETIFEVENVVESVFPDSSRRNSYFPDREQYQELLNENFLHSDPDKIRFPIHFHTHPSRNVNEDVKYYHQIFHPLNPSEADMQVSDLRHLQFGGFRLLYLNSIITGEDGDYRIMFYGKGVTPRSFTKEKGKQLIGFVGEVTEEIESEGWRLAARILIGGMAVFGAFSAPAMIQPMMDEWVYALDKKEYWGKLEKGNTVIKIPASSFSDNDGADPMP